MAPLLGIITLIACLSQNLIPIHIAYIPILIPPMLVLMNKMRLDRRAVDAALPSVIRLPTFDFHCTGDALYMMSFLLCPAERHRPEREEK